MVLLVKAQALTPARTWFIAPAQRLRVSPDGHVASIFAMPRKQGCDDLPREPITTEKVPIDRIAQLSQWKNISGMNKG
ncbi:MAG: hypothetical protein IPN98_02340 [Propionivibrio sp.]|nr:hypothetical protein [Propionivibrio sp.]